MRNQVSRAILVSLVAISMIIVLVIIVENPAQASFTLTPTPRVMPVWKALLLVYHNTDVTYTDSDGTTRHLVTTLTDGEVLKALWAFRQYTSIAHDFSAGEALIQYDVIHVTRPITSVSSLGEAGYWVSPSDIQIELDEYAPPGSYDSILVHWAQCDQSFSQCVPSAGWGWGLQPTGWAHGATYATVTNAPDWMWELPTVGEPWLHEWLHGVCSYYADLGYTMPTGCADGGSSHGYTWSPTTGWAAYYRDLMTGHVIENGDHTGITAEAWQTGSILQQSARIFVDYFYADTLGSYDRTGVMVWDSTGQNVRTESASPGDSRLYAPVTFARTFTVVGRVHVPDTGVGLYDSIAVALRNDQIEYWGTLAYGTNLVERNHISIMRNDSWGDLYPLTLTAGWYTVKMQVDQSARLIRMKAWADGTNEPNWQTTRTLDPGWTATGIGFRHSGDGTTWMDDLFVRESPFGSITVIKQTDPVETTQIFDFTLGGAASGSASLSDGGSHTFEDLNAGVYELTEDVPSGWALDDISCDVQVTSIPNGISITLGQGEDVTCTFYDSEIPPETGSITVIKQTTPDAAAQVFDFTLGGDASGSKSLSDGQSHTFSGLNLGTYTLTETVPSGWTLDSIDCGAASVTSITNGVSISLAQGDDVTCTFYDSETPHWIYWIYLPIVFANH